MDDAKRELQRQLRLRSTPLDPEDIYELSERLDQVIGAAKDLVREAEALSLTPDPALAAMASLTVQGVDDLAEGFAALPKKVDAATARAPMPRSEEAVSSSSSMCTRCPRPSTWGSAASSSHAESSTDAPHRSPTPSSEWPNASGMPSSSNPEVSWNSGALGGFRTAVQPDHSDGSVPHRRRGKLHCVGRNRLPAHAASRTGRGSRAPTRRDRRIPTPTRVGARSGRSIPKSWSVGNSVRSATMT